MGPVPVYLPCGLVILLVEDDEAIASGLSRVLDSQGFGVRRLARGAGAVEAASDVELVILDLGLPDVDGIDVCRRLRRAQPELAILILTARDQELDIVAGLDAGADDYLVKPFRLPEVPAPPGAHLPRAAPPRPPAPHRAPPRAPRGAAGAAARRFADHRHRRPPGVARRDGARAAPARV